MESKETILDIAKLSKKSQITIPKIVRFKLDLDPGDRIVFIEKDGEVFIRKA
jgi:AbrB family looped-hinge helix DNA binding protein